MPCLISLIVKINLARQQKASKKENITEIEMYLTEIETYLVELKDHDDNLRFRGRRKKVIIGFIMSAKSV